MVLQACCATFYSRATHSQPDTVNLVIDLVTFLDLLHSTLRGYYIALCCLQSFCDNAFSLQQEQLRTTIHSIQ